ncbi:TPA: polyribonucleotide nucleotidyltransferase [Patescibacteria group bacterium]|mgnify:FL=1|jgi:polyribonucleotide nucleotidyltransferase|nr:polyribonucleotide nucleotidyltransferase [Patescibacteria group bacterium]
MSSIKSSASVAGAEWKFETGKLAGQANGAVLAQLGDTIVLATAVMSKQPREGMDFFPLLVDYEERLYAAGKIKGSRWMKREGRATDDAILTGRVIDRTLRPMFPDNMRNDVQVVVTILSVDGENDADIVAVNAAAMALHISDIPFDGPVASVRVAKVDGQYVANPTNSQRELSAMDLVVCGTAEHIIMVEAGANLVPEEEIVAGIEFAQKHLAELCSAQEDLRSQVGKPKVEPTLKTLSSEVFSKVAELLTEDKIESAVYVKNKAEREANIFNLINEITEQVKAELGELEGVNVGRETAASIDKIMKKYIQKQILEQERRVDGRRLDETRLITAEVGVLPRAHGSALFTRGETQILTVVTLGSKGDEQLLDGMDDPTEGRAKRYIHHYNFPGYSVGEVAPNRGPGRREVGHGALAERAVEIVLPKQEDFPYTMRLVSETMSSNGSTSMASTCGSTLSLMDAGVPISDVIGGVAMGLVMDESNPENFKVLTDIAGIEDFNGHMDFKVTGNESGITALQLDIKVKGLTPKILAEALDKAKPARLHIISKMKEALDAPRPEMSPYAPRITSFKIDPEKIREVIGSGGKTINGIIAECPGVKIDIEDDGLVMVTSTDATMSEKAVKMIQDITREVEVGEEFEGKVVRIMDFGAFVEILPGRDGMVHVSQLANYHVNKVEDVVKLGDTLKVKVQEIDDQGRINLTHKPYAPEPTPEQLAGSGDRGNRGFDWKPKFGGGDRGGRGGDRGRGNSRGGHPQRAPRPNGANR